MATSRSLRQSGSLVTVIAIMLATSQPASARPYKLRDEATARCKNLLPENTGVVMNGVFVAPSGVGTVVVSRLDPTVTVQLVVADKLQSESLNSRYSVPVAAKLVNAPRILFVLELRSGESCGCGAGELCLKTPSLLGYFGFQHCAAPIKEPAHDDVISMAPSPFSKLDYPSHIQVLRETF